MELSRLIAELSEPSAYPGPVAAVEVRQTHISVVFLAGDRAYKIKKPANMGFLDFTTLEKRRRFCDEEVRLNRRLAPSVYLGVVPVARSGGSLKVAADGEVVEWAVAMKRLPDEATLESRLAHGDIGVDRIEAFARKVARFHAEAPSNATISACGRHAVVAGNSRENFEQAGPQVGVTIDPSVFARLRDLSESAFERLRPLVESRADRDVPRDTHGDLRLEHVYLFPEREPPEDLVVVDCIEFNERFRFADPVADMAFVVMDLIFHGRPDLAEAFSDAYFRARVDEEGRALLPFYVAYRAMVRAKVEGFELTENEIPVAEKRAARQRSRAHWLLALNALEVPERRPCLVLIGGLPGTGKSTLALALAELDGFTVIRSDVVRKELAGPALSAREPLDYQKGIYTPDWSDRTYCECLRRAEAALFRGERVIVDAGFSRESTRLAFLQAAVKWGVPGVFLCCRAEPAIVRQRLANRVGDASDADWQVYVRATANRQESRADTARATRTIDTGADGGAIIAQAIVALREFGLAAPG
jgi:uncharacterized protein